MANNLIQGESLQHKVLKRIPVEITWTTGTPAISWNPENESIVLTDTGTGDVLLTFANASLVPLKLMGHSVRSTAAGTLGLNLNQKGAATTTAISVLINSDADGTTETDPVSVCLDIVKMVLA